MCVCVSRYLCFCIFAFFTFLFTQHSDFIGSCWELGLQNKYVGQLQQFLMGFFVNAPCNTLLCDENTGNAAPVSNLAPSALITELQNVTEISSFFLRRYLP